MRKRRDSIVRVLFERCLKLLLAFAFGLFTVALPSAYIYKHCKKSDFSVASLVAFLSDWKSYLEPGHLSFLPYLFLLAALFMPYFAFAIAVFECNPNKSAYGPTTDASTERGHSSMHHQQHQQHQLLQQQQQQQHNDGDDDVERRSSPSADWMSASANKAVTSSGRQLIAPRWMASVSVAYAAVLLVISLAPYSSIAWLIGIGLALLSVQRVTSSIEANELHSPVTYLARYTVNAIYAQCRHSHVPLSHTVYAFGLPMAIAIAASVVAPEFQFSPLALALAMLLPLLSAFWPNHVHPLACINVTRVRINVQWLCMFAIFVLHVYVLTAPNHLPPPLASSSSATADAASEALTDAEHAELNIVQMAVRGAIVSKKLYGVVLMAIGHSAFYLMGFYWLLFERRLPSFELPRTNIWTVIVCVLVVAFGSWLLPASKGFFYATAGYVSFHNRHKRFFYHLGSWFWIYSCLLGVRVFGNEPYDRPGLEGTIMRFLRSSTFATFFSHPLWGYLLGCLLMNSSLPLDQKALLLHIGVYSLSFAYAFIVKRIPVVRLLMSAS